MSEEKLPPEVLALPIFPVRLQTSIFGASELNFRVRDGNGWTLTAINTNLLSCEQESKQRKLSLLLVSKKQEGLRTLKTEQSNFRMSCKRLHPSLEPRVSRSSPRRISTGQLHTLLHFHLRPIYDIVYIVPYSING